MYAPGYALGPHFRLGEFPCWERATAADVAALQETVTRVLEPVRARWGPVVPTSWKWWRDGCRVREGAHGEGGTVDFVVPGARQRDVFDWGVRHLLPAGYVGRWIYEPATAAQGAHIHVAPVADMVAAFGPGKGDVGAFVETGPGEYSYADGTWGGHTGASWDPIPIPGLDVTVPGPGGSPYGDQTWAVLLMAAIAAGILLADREWQPYK